MYVALIGIFISDKFTQFLPKNRHFLQIQHLFFNFTLVVKCGIISNGFVHIAYNTA